MVRNRLTSRGLAANIEARTSGFVFTQRGRSPIWRAQRGIPQVETDSVASLFAQVATGNWASIVPHTWLWAMPMSGPTGGEIRAVELVDPVLKAQIALATNALGPGSPVARALITCAQALALNEFFDTQLRGITRRR